MRRIASLFFVFSLWFLVSNPALSLAQSAITPEGAANLKKQVEDILRWRTDMAKAMGRGLTAGDAIEVTPKDGFYEVKIPGISSMAGADGKLDVGTVIFTATPGASGEWLTQMTVPTAMKLLDKANAEKASVTIGTQKFSGTWWPEKEIFSRVDALYQDVKINGTGEVPVSVTIGSLKLFVDMQDSGGDFWSGPADFEAKDIKISVPGKNTSELSIASIVSHSVYDKVDLARAQKMKKDLEGLTKGGKTPSEKETQAFLESILSQSSVSVNGVATSFEVNGFRAVKKDEAAAASLPPGAAPPPAKEIVFDKASFMADTSGMLQDKAKISVKNNMSGLRLPFLPADYAGLIPHEYNAEIRIENLPVRKIMEMVFGVVQKAVVPAAGETPEKSKEKTEAAVAEAGPLLLKLLQEAGASLTIENTYTKSADLETSLAGKVEVTTAEPVGTTGKLALTVKGMDTFIQKMKTMAVQAGADPSMMLYTGILASFEAQGQPGVAPDGKQLRTYIFEVTPEGKILLNGVDLPMPGVGALAPNASVPQGTAEGETDSPPAPAPAAETPPPPPAPPAPVPAAP